jgi:CubicO group peptidase (beta-lactamase class C family)
LALTAILLLARSASAAEAFPRSTPEAQGVSSQDVRAYVEAADQSVHAMHSFMLLRHGNVVAEGWWKPESADKPHVMWSVSKSWNSTAVGLAIAEGKLSLDDPVLKFFPDLVPVRQSSTLRLRPEGSSPQAADPSENLKAMRVRDLLTMSCGQEKEIKYTFADGPTVKAFLAQPVPFKPGTHFLYNTAGSYVLSAIVSKVTGQTSLEFLKPRLFEPLGIDNPRWDTSHEGNSLGGYGLYLRTEDLAKLGQLYLQKGKWHGKQIVPESWVEEATSKQVENDKAPSAKNKSDWAQGYGFQFWRCRHNAFRADGKDGQFCIVLPQEDAVITITADTHNMQAELNVVWDKLLPAFHAESLPANPEEDQKLKQTLAGLEVHADKK